MKLTVRRVSEGDWISKFLKSYGVVGRLAPADGLIIEQEYTPSVYLRLEDLKEFWESAADEVELDSWREDEVEVSRPPGTYVIPGVDLSELGDLSELRKSLGLFDVGCEVGHSKLPGMFVVEGIDDSVNKEECRYSMYMVTIKSSETGESIIVEPASIIWEGPEGGSDE